MPRWFSVCVCTGILLVALAPTCDASATRSISVSVTDAEGPVAILTVAGTADGPTPVVDANGGHRLDYAERGADHTIPLQRCPYHDRLLIDVRTLQEYQNGHYPDAIRIDYQIIIPEIYRYTSRRDQVIELYCRSGNRAGTAQSSLTAQSFTEVINLGGYVPGGNG